MYDFGGGFVLSCRYVQHRYESYGRIDRYMFTVEPLKYGLLNLRISSNLVLYSRNHPRVISSPHEVETIVRQTKTVKHTGCVVQQVVGKKYIV